MLWGFLHDCEIFVYLRITFVWGSITTREPGTAITHSAHVRRESDLGSDAFCTAPLILTNLNLQQDYTSLKIGWINRYDTSLELLRWVGWWVDIY